MIELNRTRFLTHIGVGPCLTIVSLATKNFVIILMFCQKHGDYEDYEDVAEDDQCDDSDDIDEGTEEQARLDPAEVVEQNPWTATSHLSISEPQEEETQGCTSKSQDLAASARRPLSSPRPLPRAFSVCTCKLWTFHTCTWSIHLVK